MRVWVLTEIWDDSDPGDKASLSKVRVFSKLESAVAALLAKGELYPDVDIDDVSDDMGSDTVVEWDEAAAWCRLQGIERFTWLSRPRDDGWDGGYIYSIDEVEVEP